MNRITSFRGLYMFLSNFSHWPCIYENIWYPTSEHAYQAAKTLDLDKRTEFASLKTPREAQQMGQRIGMRPDWDEIKYYVMKEILVSKFTRNEKVKLKLLATNDDMLIEGNTWHDNIWGDCYCNKCKDIEGRNWLGKILMEIRSELRASELRASE